MADDCPPRLSLAAPPRRQRPSLGELKWRLDRHPNRIMRRMGERPQQRGDCGRQEPGLPGIIHHLRASRARFIVRLRQKAPGRDDRHGRQRYAGPAAPFDSPQRRRGELTTDAIHRIGSHHARTRRVPQPDEMMVEPRYTSVMRSTRSGNYYNVPIAADVAASPVLSPDMSTYTGYDDANYETVAAAWGTTTMRRLPAIAKRRDLNAALDSVAPSKDPHAFQPAFAFDLNKIVASLMKNSAGSSHNSSFTSTRSGGYGEPVPEPDFSRISALPSESGMSPPRQRGRRGAMSGEDLARPYTPKSGSRPENSIITYSLNKRKQKRLAAKALAAASQSGPNFEVAVADAGNEHQPQYMQRYQPQYQAAATTPSRNREMSLDDQSYAL